MNPGLNINSLNSTAPSSAAESKESCKIFFCQVERNPFTRRVHLLEPACLA
jgi:hypothetical protein